MPEDGGDTIDRRLPVGSERVLSLPSYVAGRSALDLCHERGITDVLELAANQNPLGASPLAQKVLQDAAHDAHLYPDGASNSLRAALGEVLGVAANAVVATGGAEQALGLLAQAFLEPGSEAVMPRPSFPVYRIATIASGATPVEVDLDGWEYDATALADAITPATRIVFAATPNNPTGTSMARADVERLLAALPEGALLVLDEAYVEYSDADHPDGIELLAQDPRIVAVRTFSKAYGLAGLRVGYLVGHPAVADLVTRVRPAFALNRLAEHAAVAALGDHAHLANTREVTARNRRLLTQALDARGLPVPASQANFVWADTGRDDDRVWERLIDHGVVVRGGRLWGHPGHLRITIGTESQTERLLHALDDAMDPA
ncbi:histidinol-phosphate transaminase [Egibacter rhizosphaerae]|nr:histidinol-phosphate transaminase [Egibacter rhizosphaerae]